MTQMPCDYGGDRDQTLIAYVYDDIDPAERAAFDAHLSGCATCRDELAALRGVRTQLTRWNPPTFNQQSTSHQPSGISHEQLAWWRAVPAWAQVAAALLFLGVSAGIAHLDVRYDANGFAIRTGWSNSAAAQVSQAGQIRQKPNTTDAVSPVPSGVSRAPTDAVTKADLVALAQQLRQEMRGAQMVNASAATARAASATDPELLRKVRALVDESERRQQRELALRMAQVITDVDAQRQADLRKIDSSLNGVQRSLGVEVLKQQERVNYLMRVNQRQ